MKQEEIKLIVLYIIMTIIIEDYSDNSLFSFLQDIASALQ